MRTSTVSLALAVVGTVLAGDTADQSITVSFSPQDLPMKSASCRSVNRVLEEVKDIEIEYVEMNPGAERTLLMVHGWPSLWHSWKFQIEEFKNDYHLIIPNLRGFGASTHPGDVEYSGTWYDIVGDLTCVLEHAKVERAICVGHDWGAQLCYEAARERPDVIEAVVGVTIPYIPSVGIPHSAVTLSPAMPKLTYQLFLQNTSASVPELGADVRRTLRATLRSRASPPPKLFLTDAHSYLAAYDGIEIPPIPFLTPEEEDYWVEQYTIQKFQYNLQFYTQGNRLLAWTFADAQGNQTIPQPALSILALNDPVANWEFAAKLLHSADFIPHLTTVPCQGAHWIQLENPSKVNSAMREWLGTLPSSIAAHASHGHATDEL